jgi:acid phosphatase
MALGANIYRVGHHLCALAVWLASLTAGGAASAATGILAVGDFGVGGEAQRSLGEAMRRFEDQRPADLLITLGDNDYTASAAGFARNWKESFNWLEAAGVRIAGTLGNHDVRVDGGRYEFPHLGMRRRYHTRTSGDVQLLLLDSNRVDQAQTVWLRRTLQESLARWKVAVFHHPAYTCGTYRSHPAVVRSWVPLFERYGVRLVLSGHDHNYQRFAARNGVTYVVHGGGTPNLYALQSCPPGYPRRVFGRAERGFLYLNVRESELRGLAVDTRGRVVDRFTIYSPPG